MFLRPLSLKCLSAQFVFIINATKLFPRFNPARITCWGTNTTFKSCLNEQSKCRVVGYGNVELVPLNVVIMCAFVLARRQSDERMGQYNNYHICCFVVLVSCFRNGRHQPYTIVRWISPSKLNSSYITNAENELINETAGVLYNSGSVFYILWLKRSTDLIPYKVNHI